MSSGSDQFRHRLPRDIPRRQSQLCCISRPSTDHTMSDISLDTLKAFRFDRVLSESESRALEREATSLTIGSLSGSVFVLGQLGGQDAILHLQRTVLPTDKADRIIASLEDIKFFLENRPVSYHCIELRG